MDTDESLNYLPPNLEILDFNVMNTFSNAPFPSVSIDWLQSLCRLKTIKLKQSQNVLDTDKKLILFQLTTSDTCNFQGAENVKETPFAEVELENVNFTFNVDFISNVTESVTLKFGVEDENLEQTLNAWAHFSKVNCVHVQHALIMIVFVEQYNF